MKIKAAGNVAKIKALKEELYLEYNDIVFWYNNLTNEISNYEEDIFKINKKKECTSIIHSIYNDSHFESSIRGRIHELDDIISQYFKDKVKN